MARTESGEGSFREIDRFDGGVGWIAFPDERMERASHALAVADEGDGSDGPAVWVVDPVDAPGVDELLANLGEVAGVVLGLDRHKRDCAAIAARHDVAVHVPEWMTGVAAEIDAPIERFGPRLADTDFEAIRVRQSTIPPWQEVALYDGETLVVPEAVGTASFFLAPSERLGVHPMLRAFPPRDALDGLDPDRILVGHGAGIHDRAGDALREALSGARRNSPDLFLRTVKTFLES